MKYTIKDFQNDFKTDSDCLNFIFNQRYPDGGKCVCGKSDCFYPVTGRRTYACSHCGKQISPTEGTIFHKSPTSLLTWFYSIFLMSSSKNGVAAKELERQTGVTYKCAWRMAHQIRKLMDQCGNMLSGVVEADETYVGGRSLGRSTTGRSTKKKAVVIGVLERGGEIRAKVVEKVSSSELTLNLVENVKQGTTLCTDEWRGYNYATKYGYVHCTVNHSEMEWARASVHTNSIEGFWSQLKRSINGTFHSVSKKHLQRYVDEFCFRYNRRKSERPIFLGLSGQVSQRIA